MHLFFPDGNFTAALLSVMKIHYFSGLIMTAFVGLHLFNHFCALWGAGTHIEIMNILRPFYRNTWVESLLLAATGVQVISGIRLVRMHRKTAVSGFDKLQILTGLYLAFFLIIHVSAVFAGRLLLNLDTNFFFGVAGLNTFPYNLFFIPYYGLAIFSFFGHIASVHSKKMQWHILGLTPGAQAGIIISGGLVFTFLLFYGLTNQFKGVEIPESYRILAPQL